MPTTQDIKKDVKNAAKTAEGEASRIIGFDRDDLREMAHRAGENVREFISERSDQAAYYRDEAEELIVKHPFRSILGALAGGIILGMLLRGRNTSYYDKRR